MLFGVRYRLDFECKADIVLVTTYIEDINLKDFCLQRVSRLERQLAMASCRY